MIPLLGFLGPLRLIMGPFVAAFMSFVNTPIGAGVTAGVAAHYFTKWSVQRSERIECNKRAAESQRQAYDFDTKLQVEMLMKQEQNRKEIEALKEQAKQKDVEYEAALEKAEKEAAEEARKAAGAKRCPAPRGRTATDADDRRVFPD